LLPGDSEWSLADAGPISGWVAISSDGERLSWTTVDEAGMFSLHVAMAAPAVEGQFGATVEVEYDPSGLWWDGDRLLVGDANGQCAVHVVGVDLSTDACLLKRAQLEEVHPATAGKLVELLAACNEALVLAAFGNSYSYGVDVLIVDRDGRIVRRVEALPGRSPSADCPSSTIGYLSESGEVAQVEWDDG
jgi:hypothetical protein